MKRFFVMVASDNEPKIEKEMREMEHILKDIGASPVPWMLVYGKYEPGHGSMIYGYRIDADSVVGLPAIELRGSEDWI